MNNKADVGLPRGEVVMTTPESQTAFAMTHRNWNKLREKIRTLQIKHSFWGSFGWKDLGMVFWGITLTSIASFWLPGYTDSSLHTTAVMIAGGSFILGGLLIFFQYQLVAKEKTNTNDTVSHIIELMNFIEENYSNQIKKD
ncbi:hypothetical protein [Legionella sainthelensi]|uniref:hypothetical protein n=1 Tax=Legionella sainthelensi TaxID=28087 RepID=UPI000E20A3D6|nr:hypothetical protein [Legionella sainthelensi]